jgi:nicotinamidase-related amidase
MTGGALVANPLLVVDVQLGFLNKYTEHLAERVATLIERGEYDPILFTRFVNAPDGPYPRFLDWDECMTPPETDIAPELYRWVEDGRVFTKPGYAGISDELAEYLTGQQYEQITIVGIDTDMCVLKVTMDIFDLNIRPIVLVDCCGSTAGLQSHLAGLAVLARNIGADHLRDAGLSGGSMAAPIHTAETT